MAKKKRASPGSESSEVSQTSEANTSEDDMPPPANNRRAKGSPKKTPHKNIANKRMELMRKVISPETDNNNMNNKIKRSTRKAENVSETAKNTELQSEPQSSKRYKKDATVLASGDARVDSRTMAVTESSDNEFNMTDVLPHTSTSRSRRETKKPSKGVTNSEPKQRRIEINKQSLTIRKAKTVKNKKSKIISVDPTDLVNNETVSLTTLPRISKHEGNEGTIAQNSVMNNSSSQTEQKSMLEDNTDILQKRPNETPQMFQLRLSIMKKRIANESKNSKKKQKKTGDRTLSKSGPSSQIPTGNIGRDEHFDTISNNTDQELYETQNMSKLKHSPPPRRAKSAIKSDTIPEHCKTEIKTIASETIVKDDTTDVKRLNETPHMAKIRLSLAQKRVSTDKSKTSKRKSVSNTSIVTGASVPSATVSKRPVPSTTVPSTPVSRIPVTSAPVDSTPVNARRSTYMIPVTCTPFTSTLGTSTTYVERFPETCASERNDSFTKDKQFTTPKPSNETPAMAKLRESIAEKRKSIGVSLEKNKKHEGSVTSTPKRNRIDQNDKNLESQSTINFRSERSDNLTIQNDSLHDKTLEVLTEITESRSPGLKKKTVGIANKRLAMLRRWLTEEEEISDVEMTSSQDGEMEWEDIAQQIMEVRVEAPTSSIDYSSQIDDPDSGSSAEQFVNPQKRLLAVVDTNVFISNLHSLQNIIEAYNSKDGDPNLPILVVAWRVLVELDALKLRARLSGHARRAGAFLRQYLKTHPLVQGQSLEQASEHIYPCESADDEILNCCLQLSKAGQQVVLLSNDNNLCCKVTVNGVQACSVSDLIKMITPSQNNNTTAPTHNKHIKNSINNNVLKVKRRLTNTNTPYDIKSGTSPVKTCNSSPQKVSNTRNSTHQSPKSVKFSGNSSFSSNSTFTSAANVQNFGFKPPENAGRSIFASNFRAKSPENAKFAGSSNLSFQNVWTSQNFGFNSPENEKVRNQVSNQSFGGFQSSFGSCLGVRDQNNEYMKNFQDCLQPVLNYLLELCFKRQFGENYTSPPLTLEQSIRTVLQHWTEIPVQPLSEQLHRALEELRLVWVACSQGGQCSSFHVSRAHQVAAELSLAANNVKLATDQLMPAFEAVWSFFTNYCTSLTANECSIQHEVHTQLAKVLEALNRVLSLNDGVGLQSLHEVLRGTLDGIGRPELPLALETIQVFCNNNRNLLEEAHNNFSQLATTLNN